MSHTPGPWKVGKVNHKKQRVDIDTDASDIRTGYCNWSGFARAYGIKDNPSTGSEIMQANARLIAAAPSLLDALCDLLDTTEDIAKKHGLTYSNLESLNATADAAIRLATGDE